MDLSRARNSALRRCFDVITLRHIIDETSPLHHLTLADIEKADSRFTVSIVCIDTVIPAPVQSHHSYTWRNIRFNHKFAEIYDQLADGTFTVDYARVHTTEPIASNPLPLSLKGISMPTTASSPICLLCQRQLQVDQEISTTLSSEPLGCH